MDYEESGRKNGFQKANRLRYPQWSDFFGKMSVLTDKLLVHAAA
jgi:hypothetical protein